MANVLAGTLQTTSGSVVVDGKDLSGKGPEAFINEGVGYIPADRQQVGLVLPFSIGENLVLRSIDCPPICKHGVINHQFIKDRAIESIRAYDIRAASAEQPVSSLSGGNQQKVILARELENELGLLIAAQPTRGLDVGAANYIQSLLLEQREQGLGILLISSDLDEILALSDRIAVLFRGEFMGVLRNREVDKRMLGTMMLGKRNLSTQVNSRAKP